MIACAYLLSLDDPPVPPELERSYTAEEWAKRCTDETIDPLLAEKHPVILSPISSQITSPNSGQLPVIQPKLSSLDTQTRRPGTDVIHNKEAGFFHGSSTSPPTIATSVSTEKSFTNALKDILDLHTARRMKAPIKSTKDMIASVRIPSQLRFLYYWALLLAHEAPKHMWDHQASVLARSQSQALNHSSTRPRVYLTQITLRMRDTSKIKASFVQAASVITGKTSAIGKKSKSRVRASLSKYDDFLIDGLEKWEVYTRNWQGNRRGEDVANIFEGGNWDKGKMLSSFAHFGVVNKDTDGKIQIYVLRPTSDKRWANLQSKFHSDPVHKGVLLDVDREVKVKLYMGQVLLGWFCFVPTFHMPQPSQEGRKSHLLFIRNDIDFPLGIGGGITDVKIEMEWTIPGNLPVNDSAPEIS